MAALSLLFGVSTPGPMWKVSLVGHSQLPPQLSVPDTEINIYRAPGGKATTFFSDERLNDVLTWTHDLCILWLGSNDIREDSEPQEIVNDLVEVVESIEELSVREWSTW